MRLIDADALIAEVDESIFNLAFTSPYQDEIERVRDGMEGVRDCIDSAPTINPEDLRPKGRWGEVVYDAENNEIVRPCSECGFESKEHLYYCPNCGAKMEEQ